MTSSRDDFPVRTKELLAKRVGYRCSNPSCRQLTTGPQQDSTKIVNVGVAAHITAAASGGPRYKESLSIQQRKSSANGIWLCQKCAKLVDSDPSRYTIDILNLWKLESENKTIHEIEGNTPNLNELSRITEKKIQSYEKLFYAVKKASATVGELFENKELSAKEKQEIAYLVGLDVAMITDEESFHLDHEVVVQSIGSFIGIDEIFELQSLKDRQKEIDNFRKSIRNTYKMIDSVKETGKLDKSIQTPIVKYFKHLKKIQDKKDLED